MSLKAISVFCGSRSGQNSCYQENAVKLGHEFAKRQIQLVYGAGNVGLMGLMADATLEKGGEVIGVIPHFLRHWEVCHEGLTELVLVDTLFERKLKMAERSDGIITLSGGFGTLDELFEMVTLVQLKRLHLPIGILNVNGFYDHLLQHFQKMYEEGFISDFHYHLVHVDDNIDSLLKQMEDWVTNNPTFSGGSPNKWG